MLRLRAPHSRLVSVVAALVGGALVCGLGVGCGSGHHATATTGGDLGLLRIESAVYAVANLTALSDGCEVGLTSSNFATLAVGNDGNGGVTLGTYHGKGGSPPFFDPAAYTGGNGRFSDDVHGTTLTQTHVTSSVDAGADACNYDVTISTVLTVTGNDRLHVALTHHDDNIANCTTPPGTSCTSNFTFDLGFVPPPDMTVSD